MRDIEQLRRVTGRAITRIAGWIDPDFGAAVSKIVGRFSGASQDGANKQTQVAAAPTDPSVYQLLQQTSAPYAFYYLPNYDTPSDPNHPVM